MTAPLLVFRVGYMERYDGPDTISGGGSYIDENGVGGEVFNFKPSRGKCYGYVRTKRGVGLNLKYLDSSRSWQEGDELSGVDVVFIARRPGVGQVVVGWYRNATVFHRKVHTRSGATPKMDQRWFLCKANADTVRLLAEHERTFKVPIASAGSEGFPGQSNVWYPSHNVVKPGVAAFIRKLTKYIDAVRVAARGKDEVETDEGEGNKKRTISPDHAHNAVVEKAAVSAVWTSFEAKKYLLRSVEDENLGWDLVAIKGEQSLLLEVKGRSGADIYFELTPNEYAKLKKHRTTYRVCVVCDALTEHPRVFELKPEATGNGWRLASETDGVTVLLKEQIAAIGTESDD